MDFCLFVVILFYFFHILSCKDHFYLEGEGHQALLMLCCCYFKRNHRTNTSFTVISVQYNT